MTGPATPVLRHRDADVLAAAVAARLVTRLVDLQAAGRDPAVVLTGGSIADAIHAAVAASPARQAVDWGRVDFWFGDERFVPEGDEQRNAGKAAQTMLGHLPVDPARIHAMAPSDGRYGEDVDAAAAAYADELRARGRERPGGPLFDVLMLGIGPDGHCASLFPGRPEIDEQRPVVAVRDSPKPPPDRITLTLEPLGAAAEVWWVAAGGGKAEAVRNAVRGADVHHVPAAGPKGRERTWWFLDEDAAGLLGGR